MKFNFRKISAVVASGIMAVSSIGLAAAAYPAPFIVGGSADVSAIVYGSSAPNSLDAVQAGSIQTDLQSYLGASSGGSTTATGADFYEVGTSSDKLELGESIKDVDSYIDDSDLKILGDGTITNEKGEATYNQYFYFEDTASSYVTYTEDDDDNIGLFFKVSNGKVIARYDMDFTKSLDSDVGTSNALSDIEDKDISLLGKTYTIVTATNASGVKLTLMSGADKATISNDEEITVGGYTVSAVISSATSAKFTVNGETTDKMAKGEMSKLSDGNYIAVTDITYEQYAGGLHQATFYIGADKIELNNGSALIVNGETISASEVIITHTETSGDVQITDISVNMTAEDDLYVPENKKLSEASDLDEPQVLLTQNWDIEFKGLEARDTEEIRLAPSESDTQYDLEFVNYDGAAIKVPIVWSNTTGLYSGDTDDKQLVLTANNSNVSLGAVITKNDYFILNTADPTVPGNNARSYVIQYKGGDKVSDTSPKVTLDVIGVESREVEISTAGAFTLKLGGATFNFKNSSTATADDYSIYQTGVDYVAQTGDGCNESVTAYLRTKYNTLIEITDLNVTSRAAEAAAEIARPQGFGWKINISIDDTNRDDDEATLKERVFAVTFGNTSTDVSTTLAGNANWLTDNDNTDLSKYISNYGVEITDSDPSDAPPTLTTKIPEKVARPLLYLTSGEVQVTTSSGTAATQLGNIIVTDNEVASVASKNIIIVGGSCVNSAAAKVLNVPAKTCSAAFTEATKVGAGQYLIQSVEGAYTAGKVALVVAGYEAAETGMGVTYLTKQKPDVSGGKKWIGTSSTTATLQTAAAA